MTSPPILFMVEFLKFLLAFSCRVYKCIYLVCHLRLKISGRNGKDVLNFRQLCWLERLEWRKFTGDENISILLVPKMAPYGIRAGELLTSPNHVRCIWLLPHVGLHLILINTFFNECFLCTLDSTHIILFNPRHPKIRYYHLYFINGDSVRLSITSKFTQLISSKSRISPKTFPFLPTFHCSREKHIKY